MDQGFLTHDHSHCVATALAAAEKRCSENGLRFTPVRRAALEILLTKHRAMGAYEVLEELSSRGHGTQPPVAYRALDFLVLHGLAHKIQRLNAFVACTGGALDHSPAFMICRKCDRVSEAHVAGSLGLKETAEAAGFAIEHIVIEAEGICPRCRSLASASGHSDLGADSRNCWD